MIGALVVVVIGGAPATFSADAPPDCVVAADVMLAVDAAGGIEPAERVSVIVSKNMNAATDGAGDPFVLTVDIELVGAPPLHRVAPLREVECADVPELVAVLVENQRRARVPAKTTTAGAPDAPARPAARSPAPERRRVESSPPPPSALLAPIIEQASDACAGPPTCGAPFGASVGAGAMLTHGVLVQADATIALTQRFAFVLLGNAVAGSSAGGFLGAQYRVPVGDSLQVAVRALAGGGSADTEAIAVHEGRRCAAQVRSTTTSVTSAPYVAPLIGVRVKFGWVYGELGGTWLVGAATMPALFGNVGVNLMEN